MATKTSKNEQGKFTALVYFHGMGDQKRYEEVSRLLDNLKRFDQSEGDNIFTETLVQLEPSRTKNDREVGFIDLPVSRGKKSENFRFYEAYWAGSTAGGVPTPSVTLWLLSQTLIPFKALFAPWREMTRLRRATLLEGWQKFRVRKNSSDLETEDLDNLFKAYDEFDNYDNRTNYAKGSANDFREYIRDTRNMNKQQKLNALSLTESWITRFRLNQLTNILILFTIWLIAILLTIGLVGLFGALLEEYRPFLPNWLAAIYELVRFILGEHATMLGTTNKLILAVAILFLLPADHFLREYMGDVYYWVTYEETSEKYQKRRNILDNCNQALAQVLNNDSCERVIIVAHSLGTTIALDTILELTRKNRATNPQDPEKGKMPLHKIKYLITLASPIDKIYYFFENQRSQYYQYLRVVEEIRGDISQYPFAIRKENSIEPTINWINFWDKADIISGSLQTIGNRRHPTMSIHNQETRSYLFPNPSSAHEAYFKNKEVIRVIYQATFNRSFTFKSITTNQIGLKTTRFFQILIILVPWLISIYWLFVRLGEYSPVNAFIKNAALFTSYIFYADIIFLAFIFLISLPLKHLDKFSN